MPLFQKGILTSERDGGKDSLVSFIPPSDERDARTHLDEGGVEALY